MLSWAVTFLVVAVIAGLLGLSGIAGTATQIAYVLFVVFLIFAAVSFVMGRRPPVTETTPGCHDTLFTPHTALPGGDRARAVL